MANHKLMHKMMRASVYMVIALVLAAFLLVARGFSQTTGDQNAAIAALKQEIEFDKHWSHYLTAELGCPPPPPDAGVVTWSLMKEDCHLPRQVLLQERKAAREIAMKMFGLVEPPAK